MKLFARVHVPISCCVIFLLAPNMLFFLIRKGIFQHHSHHMQALSACLEPSMAQQQKRRFFIFSLGSFNVSVSMEIDASNVTQIR